MEARAAQAIDLIRRFAARTGVAGDGPSRRYLWTDAFAVCNLIGLARATGEPAPAELALQLVRRVHQVLGRHRPDDRRSGWLSREACAAHPTRGGLRIGKPLPERGPGEPLDDRREWDRDGQYFHYLTRWMHALDQVASSLGQPMFNEWARELAEVAHRAFTVREGGGLRMVWKMSIDLSRPLVLSMGQHDALDGYVICRQLDASAEADGRPPRLTRQIEELAAMIDPGGLASDDPLGIGGLLIDAYRLERLGGEPDLVVALLAAALIGLRGYLARSDLRAPTDRRLAFRELGLAIGLAAVERFPAAARREGAGLIDALRAHAPLRDAIESTWLKPEHRAAASWQEHADINDVMLATALVPDGFLELSSGAPPDRDAHAVVC